ncbi:MAG: PAS domain S-box protein, partial [Chloroflexi bacterium]|nr:PAS domain S-box protein [Chloroflexota bacterium]
EFARLSTSAEIMRVVGEKIVAYFGFSLLTFVEVDAAADEVLVLHDQREAGVNSPLGLRHLGHFLDEPYIEQLKAGKTIAINNVVTDPDTATHTAAFQQFQICALMLAPYLSEGRLKFILGGHLRQPHVWRDDELALLSELAARVWLRLERAHTEAALRASEERYRTLFESIDEGFCVLEMLFDADNQPIDYRFMEMNPAFERHTGLIGATGRTALELVPNLESFWFETYGKVALTGKSIHFEQRAEQMHRWFDVYASRVGGATSRKVALVFNDVTERKQADTVLRESQARQAFLLELGDRMRHLTDAEALMAAATELLGQHLDVGRVVYSEIDPSGEYATIKSSWTDGQLMPMAGRYRLDDFGVIQGYRKGRTRRVSDVRTDLPEQHTSASYEALGVRAVIGVPLIENGRMSAIMSIHSATPRDWSDNEVELVRNVGERIWSETKRAIAEAKLRASEDRLRAIYDSTYEYIGLLTPDGTLLDANRASLEFANNTREDVVGQLFWETPWFTPTPGAPERVRKLLERAAAGELIHFEATLNRPNGEIKTFDISFHPIHDDDGQVVLIVPEGRDITERKQIERALQASEQQSRNILSSITDAFFAVDRDWRFTYLNQHAERLLAREPGELLGQEIWEMYPGLPGSEFERVYRRVADERIAESITAFYPDHNRWYEVHAYPAANGITAYFRNVTQRITAEAALRASEERLRRAIAIETVGVIFFKPEGQITAANDAFLRMSGYTQEDVSNGLMRWDTQTPPEWMPQSIRAIDEFETTGRTTPYEKEYFRKDGSRWWGLFAATRINETEGVEFIVDITENKQVEAERERLFQAAEQARQEAEAALQTRDQFLSIASHELRTPLTSLMGYAHLLHKAVTRGKGDLIRMADRIAYQAQRLNGLIDQMLDVSRLQRGQFAIERQPIDLAAVVAQVVEEFRSTLPADTLHPIEIQRPDQPVMIGGDANRLEQVIQNLLSNAVKYSPAGGAIRVQVLRTATTAELVIEDQGIGIPADARDHLFEPFYRASNVGEQVSGFGIGLHIVREIVQRHGGRIEVNSIEATGSIFRIV